MESSTPVLIIKPSFIRLSIAYSIVTILLVWVILSNIPIPAYKIAPIYFVAFALFMAFVLSFSTVGLARITLYPDWFDLHYYTAPKGQRFKIQELERIDFRRGAKTTSLVIHFKSKEGASSKYSNSISGLTNKDLIKLSEQLNLLGLQSDVIL